MTAIMSDSKAEILKRIRKQKGQKAANEITPLDSKGHIVPRRGRVNKATRIKLFMEQATKINADVVRAATPDDVPLHVANFLAQQNAPASAVRSPDPVLDSIPWEALPALEIRSDGLKAQHDAAITAAHAGVAETGTLILTSDGSRPTLFNFLPEHHIVVLRESQIVASYEDAWQDILAARAKSGTMPRTVNHVTGPSRTADIEQTLFLGAHGPKNLQIIILADGEEKE